MRKWYLDNREDHIKRATEYNIANYEKQIEDKVCLINELLKKVKDLTAELDSYKNKQV